MEVAVTDAPRTPRGRIRPLPTPTGKCEVHPGRQLAFEPKARHLVAVDVPRGEVWTPEQAGVVHACYECSRTEDAKQLAQDRHDAWLASAAGQAYVAAKVQQARKQRQEALAGEPDDQGQTTPPRSPVVDADAFLASLADLPAVSSTDQAPCGPVHLAGIHGAAARAALDALLDEALEPTKVV